MKSLNNIVMYACSEGGHFSQMMVLKDLFGKYEDVLVTDNVRATKEIQALSEIGSIELSKSMTEARKKVKNGASNRLNYCLGYINLFLECRMIWKKYRPKVIISTGSNIAVPLFWYGKLHGSKLIFIETRAKVYARSMTGILVRKIADQIYVQWPEMMKLYPEAIYCGTLV